MMRFAVLFMQRGREASRYSSTWTQRGGDMAAKVEQARQTVANAEHNRDTNEKALAEARGEFHRTQ